MATDRARAQAWLAEAFGPKPTPTVAPAPKLDEAVQRSKDWMVAIGFELLEQADAHSRAVALMLDKVAVLHACASLPGDMPLRIRCTPDVFRIKA